MDTKINTTPPKSATILPFSPDKRQPQLSISIDDVDTAIFYDKFYSMVQGCFRNVLGNDEDARDTTHDLFEKMLVLKSEGKLPASFYPSYLSKVAKNMGINKKKRARKELLKIYDEATNGSINWLNNHGEFAAKAQWGKDSLPEKVIGKEVLIKNIVYNGCDEVEAKIIVQAILDEQDETTRRIFFYKYHEDMTVRQIAEIVGLKKSAVQERLKKLEEQVRGKVSK